MVRDLDSGKTLDDATTEIIKEAFAAMLDCRQRMAQDCALDYLPSFLFENDLERTQALEEMGKLEYNGVHREFSTPRLKWVSPLYSLSVGEVCMAAFDLNQRIILEGFTRESADAYEVVIRESYGKKHYERSSDGMSFTISAPVHIYAFSECENADYCFLNEDFYLSTRLGASLNADELAPLLAFKQQMEKVL